MVTRLIPIPVIFWNSATGREPVREFLQALSKKDRRRIGDDIRQLQFGWPVGMPLVRKMQNSIWELRSTLPSKREARILFATDGETLALLHAFIKKAQKTPKTELALARQRLKEILQ
jgi:phage-related protein